MKIILFYNDNSQNEFDLYNCEITFENSNIQPGEDKYLTILFNDFNDSCFLNIQNNLSNSIKCVIEITENEILEMNIITLVTIDSKTIKGKGV